MVRALLLAFLLIVSPVSFSTEYYSENATKTNSRGTTVTINGFWPASTPPGNGLCSAITSVSRSLTDFTYLYCQPRSAYGFTTQIYYSYTSSSSGNTITIYDEFTWDPTYRTCEDPQVPDPETGQCVLQNSCPTNYAQDPVTGDCVCADGQTCTSDDIDDSQCTDEFSCLSEADSICNSQDLELLTFDYVDPSTYSYGCGEIPQPDPNPDPTPDPDTGTGTDPDTGTGNGSTTTTTTETTTNTDSSTTTDPSTGQTIANTTTTTTINNTTDVTVDIDEQALSDAIKSGLTENADFDSTAYTSQIDSAINGYVDDLTDFIGSEETDLADNVNNADLSAFESLKLMFSPSQCQNISIPFTSSVIDFCDAANKANPFLYFLFAVATAWYCFQRILGTIRGV